MGIFDGGKRKKLGHQQDYKPNPLSIRNPDTEYHPNYWNMTEHNASSLAARLKETADIIVARKQEIENNSRENAYLAKEVGKSRDELAKLKEDIEKHIACSEASIISLDTSIQNSVNRIYDNLRGLRIYSQLDSKLNLQEFFDSKGSIRLTADGEIEFTDTNEKGERDPRFNAPKYNTEQGVANILRDIRKLIISEAKFLEECHILDPKFMDKFLEDIRKNIDAIVNFNALIEIYQQYQSDSQDILNNINKKLEELKSADIDGDTIREINNLTKTSREQFEAARGSLRIAFTGDGTERDKFLLREFMYPENPFIKYQFADIRTNGISQESVGIPFSNPSQNLLNVFQNEEPLEDCISFIVDTNPENKIPLIPKRIASKFGFTVHTSNDQDCSNSEIVKDIHINLHNRGIPTITVADSNSGFSVVTASSDRMVYLALISSPLSRNQELSHTISTTSQYFDGRMVGEQFEIPKKELSNLQIHLHCAALPLERAQDLPKFVEEHVNKPVLYTEEEQVGRRKVGGKKRYSEHNVPNEYAIFVELAEDVRKELTDQASQQRRGFFGR